MKRAKGFVFAQAIVIVLIAGLAVLLGGCTPGESAEPAAPLPTYTPPPTYTPLPTYTPFPTDTPSPPPTYTPFPTYTQPPTFTPLPTEEPAPTATPEPTTAPAPPPPPPPTAVPPTVPPDPCAAVPEPVSGSITPRCGDEWTIFTMDIWGFSPNEQTGFWINDSYGPILGTRQTYNIGPTGGISGFEFAPAMFGLRPGLHSWVFEGVSSGHQAILYFLVTD